MKKSFLSEILLAIVVVTDAYLISHPNLIGRFGVWFYKYEYISTFPKALLTVGLSVLGALAVVGIAKRFLNSTQAQLILSLFLVISLALLAGVYLKFSQGSYALTGKAFIWGFHLLPLLLIWIFAKGLLENRQR